MHDDDLPPSEAVLHRLLREQAPDWAGLPIRPVVSSGTDNALFRIGDRTVLRLPRRASAVPLLAKELDWLPRLRGLPLAVPRLRLRGRVDLGLPCEFGLFDWMEGRIASPDAIADPAAAARALAGFLQSLQSIPSEGAPLAGERNSRRGVPLAELSDRTHPAIEAVADEIDAPRAHILWERACCERYMGPSVWLHGDLKADNLLARDGVLAGRHRLGPFGGGRSSGRLCQCMVLGRSIRSRDVSRRLRVERERLAPGQGLGALCRRHRPRLLSGRSERGFVPAIAADPVAHGPVALIP